MLNTIEKAQFLRLAPYLNARLGRIEGMLSGRQYIDIARIADAIITNAKISSLSVDKLTSGQLQATTYIDIGDPTSAHIRFDAVNERIVFYDDTDPRMVISNYIHISLPGYNALTDTDPDHFSLYTDADNILVKEFTRGASTFPTSYPYSITVAHNLGYVPLFYAFAQIGGLADAHPANSWQLIGNSVYTAVALASCNTANLNIYGPGGYKVLWYILYDNFIGSSGHSITESDIVLKTTKSGISALTSVDPNDYIFHSDLNTFKNIVEGVSYINYTATGLYSFPHNSPYGACAFEAHIKFPDGYTAFLCGTTGVSSRNGDYTATASIDANNINIYISGPTTTTTIPLSFRIFETPLS